MQTVVYPDGKSKTYSYNDISNWVTVTDENGNESLSKKDEVDRLIEQSLGCRTESVTTSKYAYDALGNKVSETDGRENTTLFVYDDLNRLTEKIFSAVEVLNDPAGQPEMKNPRVSYGYDSEGNLVKETSPMGTVTVHTYDEMNREIASRRRSLPGWMGRRRLL